MSTYTYNSETIALFGPDPASTRTAKIFNLIACVAITVATITVGVSRSVQNRTHNNELSQIYFMLSVGIVATAQLVLLWWQHTGDLPPKARFLVYYLTIALAALFSCGVVLGGIKCTTPIPAHTTTTTNAPTTVAPAL
eukprot:m.100616 g.100616  ORF g.100616 m.100616 type:complete len:138 (-) comp13176_c0_seq2:255-668(-)